MLSYLDEEQLKLELVLKGSYEDTQTSALGTASAFRFHYLAAQETELSVQLRVGLAFGALLLWASSSCHGPSQANAISPS